MSVAAASVRDMESASTISGRAAAGRLRAAYEVVCAGQAAQLLAVAEVVRDCLADVPCAVGEAHHAADAERLAHALAVDEVSVALGISRVGATAAVELAWRLISVLPTALSALSSGVVDLPRVRFLAEATAVLDDDTARRVADELLAGAGESTWLGPSPRAWRARVERAVVRADAAAAARRRAAAMAARSVRSWAEGDGTGVLQLRADVADIALADQVVTDLAHAWPAIDSDGVELTLDQRRTDALLDVFRRIRHGSLAGCTAVDPADLPTVPVRRVHDLGLVLHSDTLLGDGAAADACAEQRGLGTPAALDPVSARAVARRQLAEGAAVQVLLVDPSGALERVVRLEHAAQHCGTRSDLLKAVRGALGGPARLTDEGYRPGEALARHVRAEAPTCSFYDCARRSRACDLDHDTPFPRGPTSVANLDPKCRRHHEAKTRRLVRSRLDAGPGSGPRTVTWLLRNGLQVTTSPEPLPGCAPGVGGGALPSTRPAA